MSVVLLTGLLLVGRTQHPQTGGPVPRGTLVPRQAMEYNDAIKSILSVKQNQEKIAKRLGESSFKEWTFYRQKQMKKMKIVTFQTFCEWIALRAVTIQVCDPHNPSQSREQSDRPASNRSVQDQSPKNQRNSPLNDRFQFAPRNRPQYTPGAPVYCTWCKDNNRKDDHPTKIAIGLSRRLWRIVGKR